MFIYSVQAFFSRVSYEDNLDWQINTNPSNCEIAEKIADFFNTPLEWLGQESYTIKANLDKSLIVETNPKNYSKLERVAAIFFGLILVLPSTVLLIAFRALAYINEEISLKHKYAMLRTAFGSYKFLDLSSMANSMARKEEYQLITTNLITKLKARCAFQTFAL